MFGQKSCSVQKDKIFTTFVLNKKEMFYFEAFVLPDTI